MAKVKLRASVSTAFLASCIAWAAWQAGCGSSSDGENGGAAFPGEGDSGTPVEDGTTPLLYDADLFGGDSPGPVHAISIQPTNPAIDVTVANGIVTASPLTFTTIGDGGNVVASVWSFDRGELGKIAAATGVFTASGVIAGTGTVTARYAAFSATTTITVRVKATQNGRPAELDAGAGADGGGAGGNGGVGGEGLGGPVDDATKNLLLGNPKAPTPPATTAELGWLYPYDLTVWPRGVPAPLLQWQTTHAASAVYIHLKEKPTARRATRATSAAAVSAGRRRTAAASCAVPGKTGAELLAGVREVHHHRGLLRRTERLRLPQRALCASDAQVT